MIGNKRRMKLTEVKEGDILRFDGNTHFGCLAYGQKYTVFRCESPDMPDEGYIICSAGNHFLKGHVSDNGDFTDFTKLTKLRLVVDNGGDDASRERPKVLPAESDRNSATDDQDKARRHRKDIGLRSVGVQAEASESFVEKPCDDGG